MGIGVLECNLESAEETHKHPRRHSWLIIMETVGVCTGIFQQDQLCERVSVPFLLA